MRSSDLARLLILAAIWGASFLFMRLAVPVLGALWTTEARVAIAGLAMLLAMLSMRRDMQFRRNWRAYLVIGTVNSALPFALYSYAALTLPAGYSAIVNATSPLWGALVGAVALGESLSRRKLAGLAAGIAGVAFLVRLGPVPFTPQVLTAVLACVIAAFCYGLAGAYTKTKSAHIAPPLIATGSQLAAALVILPFLPLTPMRGELTPFIALVVTMLALLCSAVAFFIYFRLVADLGPARALTVTFLIPLFALLWGTLFLGEAINLNTLIGCALVILATWLVVMPARMRGAVTN
ncbi:MAG: DMT family transporter [Burkholderiaceae bacterium]|nr:DMT family transporter [Burkholderiaceae bacterium]